MNVVVANMYYFSPYYRENTGCLQCKAKGDAHGLQRGPFIKVNGPLLLYPKQSNKLSK